MKTLLKGGLVVDGSGMPGYRADVLLEDDKIAAIGTIATGTNVQVLDVGGLVVAPGFID